MKRVAFAGSLLLLFFCFSLNGCGGGDDSTNNNSGSKNEEATSHYTSTSFTHLSLKANISDFKVTKTSPGKLFCVTHDEPFKFFISNDDGSSWTEIKSSLFSGRYPSISISDVNNNLIFITSTTSMYKSTDGGYNWEFVPQIGRSGWNNVSIHDNIVIAARAQSIPQSTLFKSYDYGQTWINITPSKTSFPFGIMIDKLDANNIYAAGNYCQQIENNGDYSDRYETIIETKEYLYVSNDGGQSFYHSDSYGSQYHSFFVNEKNGHVMAAANMGLFISTNKGALWEKNSSLIGISPNDVIVMDNIVFVSGYGAGRLSLKISYDNMNTWESVDVYNKDSTIIESKKLGFSDQFVYFSSYTGLFRAKII